MCCFTERIYVPVEVYSQQQTRSGGLCNHREQGGLKGSYVSIHNFITQSVHHKGLSSDLKNNIPSVFLNQISAKVLGFFYFVFFFRYIYFLQIALTT